MLQTFHIYITVILHIDPELIVPKMLPDPPNPQTNTTELVLDSSIFSDKTFHRNGPTLPSGADSGVEHVGSFPDPTEALHLGLRTPQFQL